MNDTAYSIFIIFKILELYVILIPYNLETWHFTERDKWRKGYILCSQTHAYLFCRQRLRCDRSWKEKLFRTLFGAVLKWCACEGPEPKPSGRNAKGSVAICCLELNLADTFKPELLLLCHLATDFQSSGNGCKNLFSIQMLVNYSVELLEQFCCAILIPVACLGNFQFRLLALSD